MDKNREIRGVGDRIALAREAKGLKQSQLAERVEVEPAAVSQWEAAQDRLAMKQANVSKLLKVLAVPLDWLMSGGPPPAHISRYLELNELLTESAAAGGRESNRKPGEDRVRDFVIEDIVARLRRLEDLAMGRNPTPGPPQPEKHTAKRPRRPETTS